MMNHDESGLTTIHWCQSFHVAHFHHHYTFRCALQSQELGLGEPSDEGLTISGFLCIPGVCCWHVLAGRWKDGKSILQDDSPSYVMPDIAWHQNYMSEDEYDEWVREENLSHSKATDVSLQHSPAHSSWFTVTILPLLCPSWQFLFISYLDAYSARPWQFFQSNSWSLQMLPPHEFRCCISPCWTLSDLPQ